MIVMSKNHHDIINVNPNFESCSFNLQPPDNIYGMNDPDYRYWKIFCHVSSQSGEGYSQEVGRYDTKEEAERDFNKVMNRVVDGSEKIDLQNL